MWRHSYWLFSMLTLTYYFIIIQCVQCAVTLFSTQCGVIILLFRVCNVTSPYSAYGVCVVWRHSFAITRARYDVTLLFSLCSFSNAAIEMTNCSHYPLSSCHRVRLCTESQQRSCRTNNTWHLWRRSPHIMQCVDLLQRSNKRDRSWCRDVTLLSS